MKENTDGTVEPIEGSTTFVPASSVLITISQGPQNGIVASTAGLDTNGRGLLKADERGCTTRPGVFASGDVVAGARTVVEAVANSKIVAESMHRYMQEEAAKQNIGKKE